MPSVEVTLSPVLTYVIYSLDSSPVDLIKAACREFYTLEELQSAKETLWEIGDNSVLPPLKRRRDLPLPI